MKLNGLLAGLAVMLASFALNASAQVKHVNSAPVRNVSLKGAKMLKSEKLTSNVWSESFEDWNGRDYFWLPEGWSRMATPEYMTPTNPHTWFVNYQVNEYVPEPIDGQVYAEIMYNDAPQDEWLYTCELTPNEGDWLQYYVIFRPFLLYNYSKYDHTTDTFSEYDVVGDLQTYISVDGGEYVMLRSLAEEYKTVDVHEISDLYYNGYMTNKKVSIDMAEYVGHTVKIGFRYVATDGDSMWLDALRMGKPEMTVGYEEPDGTLYLGTTLDWKQSLVGTMFQPDNTPLTWRNLSSFEATAFNWTYPSANDYTTNAVSSDANLTASFSDFVSEASADDILHNIISVPTLSVDGIGGLHDEFKHAVPQMKVGGKAQTVSNGELLKTGASTCNPTKGANIILANGYPIFGCVSGVESPWSAIFGLDGDDKARITAIVNHFPKPEKEYKVRGLWVQCVGKLRSSARLSVDACTRNIYGSLDETPLGTAIIDTANIYREPVEGAEDMYYYSIPFVFADPLSVNNAVYYRLNNIEKAFDFFAPMQTTDENDTPHAYFEITYTLGGTQGVNIYSTSGLELEGKQCNNSFFFNLDMAYGDCDDWGHIDIVAPEVEVPEVSVINNTMQLINLNGDTDKDRLFNMRCGFYDEGEETLKIYPCIGALYMEEGGAFYSTDIFNTFFFEITMPQSLVGDTIAINPAEGIKVRYYDVYDKEWMVDATSGKVLVERKDNGTYNIYLQAYDRNTDNVVGMKFNTNETWRWRDYNEQPPKDPEGFYRLSRNGKYYDEHLIKSCVVNLSDELVAKMYFCETEDVTTVAGMENLPEGAAEPVIITMSKSMIEADRIWGFSAVKDPDRLEIWYNGAMYDKNMVDVEGGIDGGNADVEMNEEAQTIIVSSTLYAFRPAGIISGNYPNWNLKYDGPYSLDNVSDGISHVSASDTSDTAIYDMEGRRVSKLTSGHLYISNGKKFIVR